MNRFQTAKWIGHPRALEMPHGSFLLRREFSVSGQVARAELAVCGLGLGIYEINGRPVTEDCLTTPFTRYDKRVLYQVYDVTALIIEGKNAVGAHLGNGFYNDDAVTWEFDHAPWRHHPKLLMELRITTEAGTQLIISNGSWRATAGPAVYQHMREGERYDARMEQRGYSVAGFDDSDWELCYLCHAPGGILERSELPPIRVTGTLEGRPLGGGIYDFGQNISGWVRLKTEGEAGRRVKLTFSERCENGVFDRRNLLQFNHGVLKQEDEYILHGGGMEEWEPSFVYHGFRYVKVENAPERFSLCAKVVYTDLSEVGTFACGNEMINAIHSAARWSTLTNYHGIPTDCPHREQNGWTGDALLSAEQAIMNFDMTAAYRKWLRDFDDVQRPSGQVPAVVPTGGWGFARHSGPAWDSALIMIPWYLYIATGDDGAIRQMWPNMERYMAYCAQVAEDHVIGLGLGDWCPPGNVRKCPVELTNTAIYATDARTMAQCAAVTGEDCTPWEALAEKIRATFRERFLGQLESQTALACAIYHGMLTPEEEASAAQRLAAMVKENGYHIDCGILGTKYIFNALSEHGHAETLFRMVTNPTGPSYAHWILSGMTTLCESWEMDQSLNHHMFSEVEHWFYRHLAGIQFTGGGLVIRPCFIKEVGWVRATHRAIRVEWNEKELCVDVPCEAKIVIGGRKYPVPPGKHRYTSERWEEFE